MDTDELISLGRAVGASPADLLYIGRLVAGDEYLLDIHDLTAAGTAETASYLRTLAASEHWLYQVLSY